MPSNILGSIEVGLHRLTGLDDAVLAAHRETRNSGLPGHDGGPGNAYKHILISAEITRRWGPDAARLLGDGHEDFNWLRSEQTDPDERMDKFNNAIGIEIGRTAKTWDEIVQQARQKIEDSAPKAGDGQEGRAYWHPDKALDGWRPEWSKGPPLTYPKAGKEYRSDSNDRLRDRIIQPLPPEPKAVPNPEAQKDLKGDAKDDGLAGKSAFDGLWKPGPDDPLDRPVRDWSVEDLAGAMTHPDYARSGDLSLTAVTGQSASRRAPVRLPLRFDMMSLARLREEGMRLIGTALAMAALLAAADGAKAGAVREEPIATDCPDTFMGKWYPDWDWQPGGDFGLNVFGGIELRDGKFISEVHGEFGYRVLPAPTDVKRRGFEYSEEPRNAPPPKVLLIALDRRFEKGYLESANKGYMVFLTMYDHPRRTYVTRCSILVAFCQVLGDSHKFITGKRGGGCSSTTFMPRFHAGPIIQNRKEN